MTDFKINVTFLRDIVSKNISPIREIFLYIIDTVSKTKIPKETYNIWQYMDDLAFM